MILKMQADAVHFLMTAIPPCFAVSEFSISSYPCPKKNFIVQEEIFKMTSFCFSVHSGAFLTQKFNFPGKDFLVNNSTFGMGFLCSL